MKYNFDEVIDRHNTNAMSTDGFRDYLFGDKPDIKLACADRDLVSMWIADMDFAVAPEIIEAIKNRLDKKLLGYTQLAGAEYLPAFLDWAYARYGVKFKAEYVVNSTGVVPALYDLIHYLCEGDKKVLICTPSYGFFKHAADANTTELVCSELINDAGYYRMDFDDFREKAEDEKVSLFLLCNPHNPTGRVWSTEELTQIADICLENDVAIVADEIHCDLLREGQIFTPLMKLYPHCDKIITCMAPSKTFNLAGMMFANIIIPCDKLRKKWLTNHLPMTHPLSLVAVQAAYEKGQEWLQELSMHLDGNFKFVKTFLQKNLPKTIHHTSQSTYLAWIDVSPYLGKEINLTEFFAMHAGVLLEGGNMFVGNSQGYIRLNLACPRSKLVTALTKITEAIMSVK